MDQLYVDFESGRYVCYTYSDGKKVEVLKTNSLAFIEKYARNHNYQIVMLTY